MHFLADFSGGQYFDGFHGLSFALLVCGAIAAGVWILLFALRWFASMPKMPDAGPATNELGPETPAVANLLAHRWKVTQPAVQATLIDLAARGLLEIEQYVGENFVVRLRDDRPGVSAPDKDYERQVLDLVRRRATGGSAPVQALDLGEASDAERWMKRFRKSVVQDAKRLGLARSRWAQGDWVVLGAGLFVVLELFALAFSVARLAEDSGSGEDSFGRWDWLLAGGFVWLLSMVAIGSVRDLRDTPAGRIACARWLGVRDYFRESRAFDDAPPAAVTIWERYLSYGVALGTARHAVEALPMTADDPNAAWTRFGGDWREVHIEYPERFGFGEAPIRVFLGGLWRTAWWGGLAFFALPFLGRIAWDITSSILSDYGQTKSYERWIVLGLLALFSGWGIYLTIRFVDGVIRLWRGAADLNKRVVVEGEVVKRGLGRVAVADGKSEEVNAWIPPPTAPAIARGMVVRFTRSPRLWYVDKVEVLSHSGSDEPALIEPGSVSSGAGLLDVESVRQLTGLALNAVTPAGNVPFGSLPGGSVSAFADDQGNRVLIASILVPPLLAKTMISVLTRSAAASGKVAPQIGDSASWLPGDYLMVRQGQRMVLTQAELKARPESDHLMMAEALARRVLDVPALPGSNDVTGD